MKGAVSFNLPQEVEIRDEGGGVMGERRDREGCSAIQSATGET